MIRLPILLLALLAIAPLHARDAGQRFTSDEYRFSITLPDGWEYIGDYPSDGNDLLAASNGNKTLLVRVFRAKDDRLFNLRRVIGKLSEELPDGARCTAVLQYPSRCNLLRHTASLTCRINDSLYIRRTISLRARTLFLIEAINDSDDFSAFDAVTASADLHRTHRGNFLLAKSNFGVIPSMLLLVLYPCLGTFTGIRIRRWRRSCRTDRRAKRGIAGGLTLSAAFFICTFLALHDDAVLAGYVLAVAGILWLFFLSGNRFLQSIYEGLFG